MKIRHVVWVVFTLALLSGLAFAIPESRYRLLEFLRLERLYEGRPLTCWLDHLKASDPQTRRQAAFHLGSAGVGTERPTDAECQRVVAALAGALADTDGFVRKCAANSFLVYDRQLPLAGEPALVNGLQDALGDPEVIVRQAAVRGLWQTGAAAKQGDGVARLTAALTDRAETVRMDACRALGRIGPESRSSIPALLEALRHDANRDVRKLAAKSIGLIGVGPDDPSRPEIIAELTKNLKEEPAGLRDYAARSLGQLAAREAIPALRQAAQDKNDQVRAGANAALKMLE